MFTPVSWEEIFSPEEIKRLHFMPYPVVNFGSYSLVARPMHFRSIKKIRNMFLNPYPTVSDNSKINIPVFYVLYSAERQLQQGDNDIPRLWYFVRYARIHKARAAEIGLIPKTKRAHTQFKRFCR